MEALVGDKGVRASACGLTVVEIEPAASIEEVVPLAWCGTWHVGLPLQSTPYSPPYLNCNKLLRAYFIHNVACSMLYDGCGRREK